MPPLPNARHEAFARAMFEGCSADEAHTKAGYSKNRGNASRLKANENILMRVTELQAAAAKKSEVTVQSLLAELEHARERANSLDQLSASVKAIEAKAKVSGLLTTKLEVTKVDPANDWQCWNCEDPEKFVDELLSKPTEMFRPVDRCVRTISISK